jgi:hypothetical protein
LRIRVSRGPQLSRGPPLSHGPTLGLQIQRPVLTIPPAHPTPHTPRRARVRPPLRARALRNRRPLPHSAALAGASAAAGRRRGGAAGVRGVERGAGECVRVRVRVWVGRSVCDASSLVLCAAAPAHAGALQLTRVHPQRHCCTRSAVPQVVRSYHRTRWCTVPPYRRNAPALYRRTAGGALYRRNAPALYRRTAGGEPAAGRARARSAACRDGCQGAASMRRRRFLGSGNTRRARSYTSLEASLTVESTIISPRTAQGGSRQPSRAACLRALGLSQCRPD